MAISEKIKKQIAEIETDMMEYEHYNTDTIIMSPGNVSHLNSKENSQRLLQYTLADAKFQKDYIDFCTKNNEHLSFNERKCFFKFISCYINPFDKDFDKIFALLPHFEKRFISCIPCFYAPIMGGAGVGKTTSTAHVIHQSNKIAFCGATNSSYSAFMTEVKPNIKPNSFSKIGKGTFHKITSVNFQQSFASNCLKKISCSKDVKKSYEDLLSKKKQLGNRNEKEKHLRKHGHTILKALRPLICFTVSKLRKSFRNFDWRYRLEIKDRNHPYYQSLDEQFQFVTMMEKSFHSPEIYKKVCSIDAYITLVMSSFESFTLENEKYLPNILTLTNTLIIDEAGRLPGYFNIYTAFIWWFLQFLFNTPMLYETIPVISQSGSDSQSNVIDFNGSMLDEAVCPLIIYNEPKNILAYKSDYNRRKTNAFSDLKTSMYETACLGLENFLVNAFTYKPFIFGETFPEHIEDPRVHPNATRMFAKHAKCTDYFKSMHDCGSSTIKARDNVFISSDITLISSEWTNTDNVMEHLSCLTEEEARLNRLELWKKKKEIYAECSITSEVYNEKKLKCDASMQKDIGFNEEIEKQILISYNIYKKAKKQQDQNKGNNVLYGQELTSEEIEEIEYGEKMHKELNGLMKEKVYIQFICGPAQQLLSKEEHLLKRQHASGIAKEMGSGIKLSKAFYSSSVAKGQISDIFYDPKYDLCIEIANPDYSGDDAVLQKSLDQTVNARTVYMCLSRERYFAPMSCVFPGTFKTMIILRGVNGTIKEVIHSECFILSNIFFRLLVYCGFLEEFRKFVYMKESKNIDVFKLERDQFIDLKNKLNISTKEKEIIENYETIVTLACDKMVTDYKKVIKKKTVLDVIKLHDSLKRLIMKALNICEDFTEYKVVYFVENCELLDSWIFLLYKATQPFELDKANHYMHGDITVLGKGIHECNLKTVGKNMKRKITLNNSVSGWEKNRSGSKNIYFVMNNAFHHFFPDLIAETSMTLLLKNILIVNTYPSSLHRHVKLFDVLGKVDRNNKESESNYGLMMRDDSANSNQENHKLMHKHFAINGGESMNFPRPFKVHGTNALSNIVLKCQGRTLNFSTQHVSDTEQIYHKKAESIAMFPVMNSILVQSACTVDYMQGKTVCGECMVDLSMDCNKHLVAITRNSCSHELITANVSGAMKRKYDDGIDLKKTKIENRRHTTKFFKYR